ncbi:hypothetical protein HWV62_3981 [Athelia sp. TMB]|nr:hypothetical protein HWV62_3981 [Athelia sp. TMB]
MDAQQTRRLQNASPRNYTTTNARDVRNIGGDMVAGNKIYHTPEDPSLFPDHVVEDAAHNSYISKTGCFNGTRKEVISALMRWKNDINARPMCLLSGSAGRGKSVVSKSVADSCASDKTLAASFFFLRRAGKRGIFRHFITTLAFQLSTFIPEIKDLVARALREDPSIPTQTLADQLQKLIFGPLAALSAEKVSGRIFLIVVDALDECHEKETVKEFVGILTSACSSRRLPLRWLFTSRWEEHIRQTFLNPSTRAQTHAVELESFDAEEDIKLFLRARFAIIFEENRQLLCGIQEPWPSAEDLEDLVEKSSGLFIFASTLANFVGKGKGPPDRRLKSVLQMNHDHGLDQLYEEILRNATEFVCFRQVLSTLMLAYEELSIDVLVSILPLDAQDVIYALISIQSIIRIPSVNNEPIRLFHLSLRDFLLNKDRSGDLSIDHSLSHGTFATNCMRLLHEKWDRRYPTDAAHRYAIEYWPRHLEDSHTVSGVSSELRTALLYFSSSQTIGPWAKILVDWNMADHVMRRIVKLNANYAGSNKEIAHILAIILDPLYKLLLTEVSKVAGFHMVLEALMLAYEPPSVEDLSNILELEVQAVHALEVMQSIIHVPSNDNEPIQLNKLNYTLLRDFLVDRSRSGDLFVDPVLVHGALAARCLRALLRNLRRGPSSTDETAFYAVRYWPRHLKDAHSATIASPELYSALRDFSSFPLIELWVRKLAQSRLLVDTTNQLINFGAKFTEHDDQSVLLAITIINSHLKMVCHEFFSSPNLGHKRPMDRRGGVGTLLPTLSATSSSACSFSATFVQDIGGLLVLRFLVGLFPSVPIANLGGTIADLSAQLETGALMSALFWAGTIGFVAEFLFTEGISAVLAFFFHLHGLSFLQHRIIRPTGTISVGLSLLGIMLDTTISPFTNLLQERYYLRRVRETEGHNVPEAQLSRRVRRNNGVHAAGKEL